MSINLKKAVRFSISLAISSLLISRLVFIPNPVQAAYGASVKISNPMPAEAGGFGSSLSIDGNKLVVGTPYYTSTFYQTGIAYLYDATTGALLKTFDNPVPGQDHHFGTSVSISGDKVLIGAPHNNSGSVYLYDATTGALLRTFNNPTTPSFIDEFGSFVSISGDKVVIGAVGESVSGYNGAGSVYLYDATTGALLRTFYAAPWGSAYEYDHFGWSASIFGDKILIGAPYKNKAGSLDSGIAYLYDATTGALLQTFNNPTPATGDLFGEAVSLSGDKVWIGASGDDTIATNAGSAYLYDATTGALLQTFNSPTPTSNNRFGMSISISGNKVMIGAVGESVSGYNGAGSVYLYDATTGALLWTFNNPTPVSGEGFGDTVYLSGDKIVIGAPWDSTGAHYAGSVYLYFLQPDNSIPTAIAGSDQTANEGQSVIFDGSGSSDPDGVSDITSYNWDFGDGNTASGVTVNHTYLNNGIYTATLTVTDAAGHTSSDSVTITVNNIAPVVGAITGSDVAVLPGTSINTSANFSDLGILDTHTAVWNWGDSSTSDGVITEANGSGTVTGSHTYLTPGVYTITVTVNDWLDSSSNSTTITILTPVQATENLVDQVETFNLQQGITNSLDAKLDAAIDALNDVNANNDQATINSLQAFMSAVEAQRGIKITNEQANQLIAAAQAIIDTVIP